jgi:TusA-related sulfurtransferase
MTEDSEPSRTLDAVGLFCPEPLFRVRENIEQIEVGEILEVLADDPAAESDLHAFAKRAGHEVVLFERVDDEMRFLIKRKK